MCCFGTLGIGLGPPYKNRYFYRSPNGNAITTPLHGEPATHGTPHHRVWLASPEQDAFHAADGYNGGIDV
jgi:hypothetical protein